MTDAILAFLLIAVVLLASFVVFLLKDRERLGGEMWKLEQRFNLMRDRLEVLEEDAGISMVTPTWRKVPPGKGG